MKPLTPEQQAFAEEHHGLLLDFMDKSNLEKWWEMINAELDT